MVPMSATSFSSLELRRSPSAGDNRKAGGDKDWSPPGPATIGGSLCPAVLCTTRSQHFVWCQARCLQKDRKKGTGWGKRSGEVPQSLKLAQHKASTVSVEKCVSNILGALHLTRGRSRPVKRKALVGIQEQKRTAPLPGTAQRERNGRPSRPAQEYFHFENWKTDLFLHVTQQISRTYTQVSSAVV